MLRRDKKNYYLDIAQTVAMRSTCLRKKYGAVIVQNDEIISTGYNGAARGMINCDDLGICKRDKLNIPSGVRYELCRSVHADANAIISASRQEMLGATMFLVCVDPNDNGNHTLIQNTEPCMMCKRLILNAGIVTVIVRDTLDEYRIIHTDVWIKNDDPLADIQGY